MNANQKEALSMLIAIRHAARVQISEHRHAQTLIAELQRAKDCAVATGNEVLALQGQAHLVALQESELSIKFDLIDIGETFIKWSARFDELPRAVWLEALCCNRSEWGSARMRKYGQNVLDAVPILKAENSASRGDMLACKPLFWCIEMAMFNAMDTNPKVGRAMHDKCNETFDGVMGEWREPSLMQRLGVTNV
jgi:hypothetical protein